MSPKDNRELHDLLIRIDERVKSIQDDIRAINKERNCSANSVKIRTLERMVWGCAATMVGIAARMTYEILR
ncbi:hypothetical protein [Salidesulfovibrio onnuriiensis]|uniref:hypothetical protein n=1 Tax=Salidesulfovibrio onnuriiensis TaxID=2583823 RepID=UPI0011C73B77|nr:hypothetical protein [Salidesulfovibrio onnuriiensis]